MNGTKLKMPSAYFKTEGLIIKKMPFGEADFLVRVLMRAIDLEIF